MEIVSLASIMPLLTNKQEILEAIKQGFIAHQNEEICVPPPLAMIFHKQDKGAQGIKGDCHVKAASGTQNEFFCVKVATGFYDNADYDLPVNNGLSLLFCAKTGTPLVLFHDQGLLTSIRTAAAGALAAKLYVTQSGAPLRLGIVGGGHQAQLQAEWIIETQNIQTLTIWARDHEKANILAQKLTQTGVRIEVAQSVNHLCRQLDIVVTTTSSTAPIVQERDICDGQMIIAMGADSPGKSELDPACLAKASLIVTDDHQQCLNYGEFGNRVRSGFVRHDHDKGFGAMLSSGGQAKAGKITIIDLTGVGVQDLAIAIYAYAKLKKEPMSLW